MTFILVAPIVIYIFAAALGMVFPGRKFIQFTLCALASVLSIFFSSVIINKVITEGTMVMALGSLRAPFAIMLVADRFSAIMVLACNLVGFFCILYSYFDLDSNKMRHGFYAMFSAILVGANGIFLTGDLFNLYVWFEVLLISSFCLLTLGNGRRQLKGALPYVFINLFASTILLLCIGSLYGITGSLNMADISSVLGELKSRGALLSVAILFMLTLGIKAAVVPFFFWLPISYHTPMVSVTAIFSALLTKAAVYSLIRVFTLFFAPEMSELREILLTVAAITMLVGVLAAAGQGDFKRILSFHIISQIGYMMMGLAFFTPYALAGTALFIVHNIFIKSSLFLISGIAEKVCGSSLLKRQGGLYQSHFSLSLVFLLCAFSLTGLPPLSGFWGKLLLAQAGLKLEEYFLVAISLFVSLITLFSMTKIWVASFWKNKVHDEDGPISALALLAIYALCFICLAPVLLAGPILEYFLKLGEQLMQPALYREAFGILGGHR